MVKKEKELRSDLESLTKPNSDRAADTQMLNVLTQLDECLRITWLQSHIVSQALDL